MNNKFNGMHFENDELIIPEIYNNCSIQLENIQSRDQGKTGRCWIEASLSELEYLYKKETGEELPTLSSVFLGYHDIRLKVHYFLKQITNTKNLPVHDPLINHWMTKPVQDAGQKVVFVRLIEEYGLIPETCIPINPNHFETRLMLSGLNQKLRYAAYQIREEGKTIEEVQDEIFELIDRCMGKMPVDFEYQGKTMTPVQFYQERIKPIIKYNEIGFVNCISKNREYDRFYKMKWLYSETEGDSPIEYFNIQLDDFIKMAVLQLQSGCPVWIGVDAEHYADKEKGIFDKDLYNIEKVMNMKLELDKGNSMLYRDSMMTHAMLLCGVDIENGLVQRWCVKNSFGDQVGQNGYAYMSAEWFERYVYQIMIHQSIAEKILNKERWETAKTESLEIWDTMGCLAEGRK